MPVGETSGLDFRIGTGMRLPITVGRGPVPRHRSRAPTLAGDRPPRYGEKTPLPHRRAWALACHTRMRAGFPRQCSRNLTFAGDRPPRYGKKNAIPSP